MEKDITLKVKVFSDGSEEKYNITSPREIGVMLRNISEKGTRVALYFGEANEFILTTILSVDGQGLWLEQGKDSKANQKIAECKNLIFVGSHNSIKIQFSAGKPSLVNFHGYSAFYLPLPAKLLRLQRREYFRLMAPVINPLKCVIPNIHKPQLPPREVTIMDISSNGISLTCAEDDTELSPGESYSKCRIDLPEFGSVIGTILVKNLAELTNARGQSYRRAGCELKDLDNPSVIMLQRYVLQLQRDNIASR